jgi:U3 small nucleolar RNA-associated protein 10
MLLVDKVTNRVIRQNADDVQGSLALPISILQHHSIPVQISVSRALSSLPLYLSHVLSTGVYGAAKGKQTSDSSFHGLRRNCTDLLRLSSVSGSAQDANFILTFRANSSDEEHSLPLSSVLKRRAQALIIFVGHALQVSSLTKHSRDAPTGGAISDLVSLLIHLATLQGGSTPESNVDYISNAAQSTMSLSLGAMPAADFISAVLTTLESKEERVRPITSFLSWIKADSSITDSRRCSRCS